MSKFVLHKIESIKGIQEFSQLEINGEKQLDKFEIELKDTTYVSEFKQLLVYMEYLANNNPLPKTKFRELKGNKDKVKEYEFKSKHLRLYAIAQHGGKIVVLGGFKKDQSKDIDRFRAIKKQYLASL